MLGSVDRSEKLLDSLIWSRCEKVMDIIPIVFLIFSQVTKSTKGQIHHASGYPAALHNSFVLHGSPNNYYDPTTFYSNTEYDDKFKPVQVAPVKSNYPFSLNQGRSHGNFLTNIRTAPLQNYPESYSSDNLEISPWVPTKQREFEKFGLNPSFYGQNGNSARLTNNRTPKTARYFPLQSSSYIPLKNFAPPASIVKKVPDYIGDVTLGKKRAKASKSKKYPKKYKNSKYSKKSKKYVPREEDSIKNGRKIQLSLTSNRDDTVIDSPFVSEDISYNDDFQNNQIDDYSSPEKSSEGGDRIQFQMFGMNGPHSYKFGYDTGKGHNRHFRFEERDNEGKIHGHYGYYDQDGKMSMMHYEADPETGYHAGPFVQPENSLEDV